MTKAKTPIEKRAELAAQIMTLDLARAEDLKAIFSRPEIVKAAEDIRALFDPAPVVLNGTAATDVNVLIKHALTLFDTVPGHAEQHIAGLTRALNPEPPSPAEPTDQDSPPMTPEA